MADVNRRKKGLVLLIWSVEKERVWMSVVQDSLPEVKQSVDVFIS